MKINLIPFFLFLFSAFIGCKKDTQETQVPVNKNIVVTTIAGDGTHGFLNGPALASKFANPFDVAVGADGSIYVTDAGNHRIRKITAEVTFTFAGSGNHAIENGSGSVAAFKDPFQITIDKKENLYSLDVSDPRIRKIFPSAQVTTYAGTSVPGFSDGSSGIAQFRANEGGIVADEQGNLYIADYNNHRIRKVSASGEVSTIAGTGLVGFKDGDGDTAWFNFPSAITLDKQGNLFVADGLNLRIRKISPNGKVSTLTGSGVSGTSDGSVAFALFTYISDMVIDKDGFIYVTDNNRIRKVSPNGDVITIAGSSPGYRDGDGKDALFNDPTGLAIDAEGNLYVADTSNNRIRKISFQ